MRCGRKRERTESAGSVGNMEGTSSWRRLAPPSAQMQNAAAKREREGGEEILLTLNFFQAFQVIDKVSNYSLLPFSNKCGVTRGSLQLRTTMARLSLLSELFKKLLDIFLGFSCWLSLAICVANVLELMSASRELLWLKYNWRWAGWWWRQGWTPQCTPTALLPSKFIAIVITLRLLESGYLSWI